MSKILSGITVQRKSFLLMSWNEILMLFVDTDADDTSCGQVSLTFLSWLEQCCRRFVSGYCQMFLEIVEFQRFRTSFFVSVVRRNLAYAPISFH